MIEPSKSITAGGKTYSPREIHALLQKLASLGINRDKIIAQINPEEAALLKRLGGSGKINPRTGLLSFDDGDDGGGGGYGDDGGYGGGYDGYGGGWENGAGGTYGGGDPEAGGGGGTGSGGGAGYGGDPEAGGGAGYGGAPEAGGGWGTGSGGGAGYSADDADEADDDDEADAPAFGAQEAKSESRVGDGPSYGANVGPLQDAYDQMFADQVAANNAAMSAAINAGVFGGLPTEDYSAPSPTVGAMAGPGVSGAGLDALGGAGFGSFGLSGVQGGGAPFGGNAAPSSYDNMTMAQLDAAAQNLASQIEAINAGQQPGAPNVAQDYSGPIFDAMGNVAMPGVGPAPEVESLPEISVTASAPSWVGGAPTFSGGAGSWLGPGQNYLSEEGQSIGPFTFSGPGSGGFAPVGTNLGGIGAAIANESFSPFGFTPAGEYNAANWLSSLGPGYQGQQPDIIEDVLNAAPTLTIGRGENPAFGPREELTPPASIPTTPEEVSPVAAEPDFSNPDVYYDSGGAEPGWVEPTGLVPQIIDEGALTPPPVPQEIDKGGLESPPIAAAPVLPKQIIDWYRYGEAYPEFGFYQTNRVPTPYAARGGHFDADAYFADGGLVSQPRAPVQPTVAAMPTMAYTDGQGLVGSVAAPPGLTPYDAYGSDAQHASPMAPAPAAAAPSFGGPLQALAARNTNAAPVPAPIPQNPNLGYSLGLSGLRG